MLTEALTLGKNFAPWFGGVALVAALAGIGVGFYGGLRWQAAEVARAEKATVEAQARLAEFRGALKSSVSDGKAEVARIQKDAAEQLLERDRRIATALAALPGQVAAIMAPQFAELRRSVDAPEFDCLRRPLPGTFLDVVRRPGGSFGPPDGDGGRPPG